MSSDLQHIGLDIGSFFKQKNISSVFTLCGGHISPILVGCEKENIDIIQVRDEVSAVFAADAVSRLTDSVGVAIVTACLLYTSPSPRDGRISRMPSSA